jgi:hypothetical protein
MKFEDELLTSPINDLIYFKLENNAYLISINDTSKILIVSLPDRKVIQKIIVPFSKISNKIQITSIKDIPNYYKLNFEPNVFNFAIGTSNSLIYFYSIEENANGINKDIECIAELKGIFSVFQNKFFNYAEAKEKVYSQKKFWEVNVVNPKNFENLIDDFVNKNTDKDTEPINIIEIIDNILFAGLNSFVFKFNLKLNLLTQIMPSLASVNKILVDNGNVYVSANSRNLLLFESRGLLVSKIDTSLNCVFDVEKFYIKNGKVLIYIFKINNIFS